jgi:hypothetical protein
VTKFQIAIRKFSVYFAKPIWSFIVNCVFWLIRPDKIKANIIMRKEVKALTLNVVMSRFEWTADTLKDWTQWPSTLVYNGFKGDCDDAAALAKWWFKQNGVEADILNLYSAKEGHAICVTKDRTKMVTNERVVHLFPETWEYDIMRYFNNKYEVMF